MPSKLVVDRTKSSRWVSAASDTHAADVAKGVGRELAPYLGRGEGMPDLELLCRLIGRMVAARSKALADADAAHERELADDAAPREARDEAAAAVRGVLVDLRAAIEAAHGAPGLTLLSLGGPVLADATALAAQGREVLAALSDATRKLPKPRRAGLRVERSAFVDDLREELGKLEAALGAVAREAREAESTLRVKGAAMEDNDRAFSRGASFLAATFALAGLDDLAARVRPSARRPGEVAEPIPAPHPADPATPAGGDG